MSLPQLRPYQREVALAILDSVFGRKGLTFSVEIARQGGKNELSAQLELLLLTLYITEPKNLIKCSPTFKPQTVISMMRLKDRLNDAGFGGIWSAELGYIIRLGNARALFMSADESANVVGNTAHILLEVDESQDVSKDKYTKEFKPMGATTNVTTVHYGTTWDDATLLEEVKMTNLELEHRDGIRRHFRYDWEEIARHNPDYLAYVAAEKERLGENHPLFLTQYRLLPIHGGGGYLNVQQRAQLQGEHARKHQPEAGKVYVAGIDLAGEAEDIEGASLRALQPRRDSTVVTIGELDFSICNGVIKEPRLDVVEHYRWTGKKHTELYAQLVDILKNVWHCRRVVVDATGVGEPVSSFLQKALGSRVVPFTFTQPSKSELGFGLLAAVNSGRLKVYQGDGSPEYQEFWIEMEKAKSQYRPSQTINFYVDPSQGHDDFLMSLALLVEAAKQYEPRGARGS
ncbi:MAG: hypothetical protein A2144_04030 [Chloroflexi bacterium RBG_16_50_9]|nr:MAG: hypothetical protein A2144_04030 [Chloroflexi bacterium RBG_16_50_9]